MSSLQKRLTIIIIGLAVGPLLILGLLISFQSYRVQKNQAIELERETAHRVMIEVDRFVRGLTDQLETALITIGLDDTNKIQAELILANLLFKHFHYERLILVDEKGMEIVHQSRLDLTIPEKLKNISETPEYRLPMETGTVYYGPIQFDSYTGEPYMVMGIPLINSKTGLAASTLIAHTRWKKIWNLFSSMVQKTGEEIYLLDRDGRLVAHRNPSLVLKNTVYNPKQINGISRGFKGNKVVRAFKHISFGNQSFFIVAERSLADALSLSIDTIVITSVLIVILLTIAITLIVLVVRRIIQPVKNLAETARAITAGDLGKQAEIVHYDEIGELAQSFNNMTTKLSQTLKNLEHEVEEHGRDLESLKISEQRFRQLAENIQEVFWIVSPDWKEIYYISPAYEEIWGRSCQSLYEHPLSWAEAIVEDDRDLIYAFIESKQSGTFNSIVFPEYRIRQPNGSLRWLSARGFAVQDDNGNFSRIVGIAEDITDRKLAEDERLKLENRLRQSQKMESIGTLAGGIAHDFNNILFPLLGYSEMLVEDLPDDSSLKIAANEIVKASLRAKDLVKQILTLSRQSEQELKPLRIQSILKEALKLLDSSIPKTIDIQTDIDSKCDYVIADPTQILQIIMNLSTNAYHAMQDTGGKLKFSLNQVEITEEFIGENQIKPGNYVRLKVADTGTGIDSRIIDNIFDPYYTTKKLGKGTGLGLSVVQGIVKSCKGEITVNSKLGNGTEFHVYLPTVKTDEKSIPHKPEKGLYKGNEHILLVDDEESIVKMVKQMLERLGYTVTGVVGSMQALSCYKQDHDIFDLIITDMTMPDMTGLQLSREIKNITPTKPVIICSGFSDKISAKAMKEFKIQGFLMKPIIKSDLAHMVREVLDKTGIQ